MENELSCGWHFEQFSFLYDYYVFIDTRDYLADQLFIRHKVRVRFKEEFGHPNTEYIFIFCKCRKRDSERFRAALAELPNKMLLMGHRDYNDFCKAALTRAEKAFQKTPKERDR